MKVAIFVSEPTPPLLSKTSFSTMPGPATSSLLSAGCRELVCPAELKAAEVTAGAGEKAQVREDPG